MRSRRQTPAKARRPSVRPPVSRSSCAAIKRFRKSRYEQFQPRTKWSSSSTKTRFRLWRGNIFAFCAAMPTSKPAGPTPSRKPPTTAHTVPAQRPIKRRPPADAPILITMGEPSGIGPEVAVAAVKSLGGRIGAHRLRLVGDPAVFRTCGADDADIDRSAGTASREPGRADPKNGGAIVAAIDHAVEAALEGGAAAVVTAPIHKASLIESGFGFPGHTEYLAHLTGVPRAVMMLGGGGLRGGPLRTPAA